MRIFLFLYVFCLATSLSAKQQDTLFSEKEKQRIGMLIASSHFQKPNISKAALRTPSSLSYYLNQLDPYSKYFSTREVSFKKKRSEDKRLGLGLDLLVDGELILSIPIKNGPAFQVGFKTPAYLYSINNKKISTSNFNSYKFLVDFSSGQSVKVKTASKMGKLLDTYHIQARPFNQKHVSVKHFKRFSLLSIRQFTSNTTNTIKQVLISLPKNKPLIIDLRYNPGGDLYATIDTLSFFLKKNLTVAYLNQKGIGEPIPLKTLSGKLPSNRKIYLLLSHFTASSAEIFAQAIQHYLPQTVTIGSASAGKCLAQEIHLLEDNSAIQLSVYEVLNARRSHCQYRPIPANIKINEIETMPLSELIPRINKLL